MNQRTLVNVTSGDGYISLRTVSRSRKSPHRFYIPQSNLAELGHKQKIIAHDVSSFAVLNRNVYSGTLEITFTWLEKDVDNVSGYQETVILLYEKLAAFVRDSELEGGSAEWKVLSLDEPGKRPQFVFKSRGNLRAALKNGAVRRKLIRFLRDQFRWPCSEKIEFFDDFVPYSFTFREIRDGKPAIIGGVILHGQENLKDAYYSIHT